MNQVKVKAICLISGGLDSALATRLIQEQGIRVVAVNFVNPFGAPARAGEAAGAARVAEALCVHLLEVPLKEDYLEIVKNPRHGYGSNLNPCVDCRIHMLEKAREMMQSQEASFVVTGEVVGQRPMSQRINTMRMIEKASTLVGYLVRPLSAKLLVPTIPEQRGWIRRDDLLAISGRSRKELLRLAREKGVSGYSTPGGGCLLTDPRFAERVKDLLRHDMLTAHEVRLLRIGRHFRLPLGSKLVVGRSESENRDLLRLAAREDTVLTTTDVPGPTAILKGTRALDEESLAAGVVAGYSDGRHREQVKVLIRSLDGEKTVEAKPSSAVQASPLMI